MSNDQFTSLTNLDNVQEKTSRFSGASWFNFVQEQRLLIGGVGGIGSWLAFMLARLNPQDIIIFDPDIVEAGNMAGQLYSIEDIQLPKTEAVCNLLNNYCSFSNVTAFQEHITMDTQVLPIVFGGFDNMVARKSLYYAWRRNFTSGGVPKNKCLLIDGRLSAEVAQVFCMTGEDDYYMEQYEKDWLFDDSQAESVVCSYKQTSYCANLIASLMTNFFINWCTNQCDPDAPRSLPFMAEYSADIMHLKKIT